MAKSRNGVNMSQAIRDQLKENPKMKAKEIIASLAAKGIPVKDGLVYFIMGQNKGSKGRKKKANSMIATVAVTTGATDALATILKVKGLANQVGGLKKLKAIIDALSE